MLSEHWELHGRDHYTRHDYEGVDKAAAEGLMAGLRDALPELPGQEFEGLTITEADDFAYSDPVDGSTAEGAGHPASVR